MKGVWVGASIALLIVVVVAGVWFALTLDQPGSGLESTSRPLASPGPGAQPQQLLDEDAGAAGEVDVVRPAESVAAEQPLAEAAQLHAVAPYTGTGLAVRSVDGTGFFHEVQAEVGEPAEGKFYEGWLVKKQPTLSFVSTGRLEKSGTVYRLVFESDQDMSSYPDVVVTEETTADGLDGVPEAHVLEGTFAVN